MCNAQTNVRQLGGLTRLVRGDLSPLQRRVVSALITIDVHARDIVESLVAKKVGSSCSGRGGGGGCGAAASMANTAGPQEKA